TFSAVSPASLHKVYSMVVGIIVQEKFAINRQKTRFLGHNKRKKVTGLVINDGCGVGAVKYRKIRAKIHHLCHQRNWTNYDLLYEVSGWLAYLKSVDLKRHRKATEYISRLAEQAGGGLISNLIAPIG
ncbi:MAG: hypothetical protein ABUT20_60530, partial [Bacteroidota bacterium]